MTVIAGLPPVDAESAYGPASISSRWAAMVIDWICLIAASYMVFPIPFVLLGVAGTACLVGQHVLLFLALPLAWRLGKAPGTLALGLRVAQSDGRNPGLWRGVLRAFVIVPGGFAAGVLGLAAYSAWIGHYPSGAEPDPNWLNLAIFAGLALVYPGSTLASYFDSQGRAWHDRLSAVVILERVKFSEVKPVMGPAAGPPRPLRRTYLWLALPVLAVATFCSVGVSGGVAEGDWAWTAGISAFTLACWLMTWWLAIRIAPRRGGRWQFRWFAITAALGVTWLFFIVIAVDSLAHSRWLEGGAACFAMLCAGTATVTAARANWRLALTACVGRARVGGPAPVRRAWEVPPGEAPIQTS